MFSKGCARGDRPSLHARCFRAVAAADHAVADGRLPGAQTGAGPAGAGAVGGRHAHSEHRIARGQCRAAVSRFAGDDRQPVAERMVAAVFAVHPLHVESVAWITERKDVLSGLFGILSLAAYVWYVRRPSVARYLCIAAALSLGLMAKPILVTWPAVFLLLDYWPLGRWVVGKEKRRGEGRRGEGETIPPPLLPFSPFSRSPCRNAGSGKTAALCAGGRFGCRRVPGPAVLWLGRFPGIRSVDGQIGPVPPCSTPPTSARPFGRWGSHCIPWSGLIRTVWPLARERCLRCSLRLWCGIARRTRRVPRPWLAVGWLWYLGTLVPTIGLVQVGAGDGRSLPLPAADRDLPAGGLVGRRTGRAMARCSPAMRRCRAALLLAALTAFAWRQASYWRESETLWKTCLGLQREQYACPREPRRPF